MKFKEYNQDQLWLIPPNIEDEIPQNDLCRIINDVVDIIDTSSIENKFKEEGNTAYHPKMMLKSLYYSYSLRIFSSRRIAKEHERNIFYWYLSGKQKPDFRTISLFRNKHVEELKILFSEISKLCNRLGMIGFNLSAIDSTKIQANASREKFRSDEWIEKELNRINMVIDDAFKEAEKIDKDEDFNFGKDTRGDEIPEEVADAQKRREKLKQLQEELKKKNVKKVNESDTDAKMMKIQGKYMPAYNCQALVDDKCQVIISADVIDDSHDFYQIRPLVEDVKISFLQKPNILLGDTGYCDGSSFEYLNAEKINGYIPDKMAKYIKLEMDGRLPDSMKYKKDQFKYNKAKDAYLCPEENDLIRVSKVMSKAPRKNGADVLFHTYQCFNKSCNKSKECHNAKEGRKIYRYENQEIRDEMALKIRSKEGWDIYKNRMKIIEPVFGNIKSNIGFYRFSLRSLNKARGEFFIAACIHNLIKIRNYIGKQNGPDLKTILQVI